EEAAAAQAQAQAQAHAHAHEDSRPTTGHSQAALDSERKNPAASAAGKADIAGQTLQRTLDGFEQGAGTGLDDSPGVVSQMLLSATNDGIEVLKTGPVAELVKPRNRDSWEQALAAVRTASRAVLDLRQPARVDSPPPDWPRVPFSLLELRPSERHRIHTGWRSEGRPDTGGFESGWNTVESRPPLSLPRVAVVADGRIGLPSGVAALLAAGRALLVSTGDGNVHFAGERVSLIGGVRVRVGEFPTFGPAQRRAGPTEDPIAIALDWLRSSPRMQPQGHFDVRPASVLPCQSLDPRVRAIRAFLLVQRLHPYLPRPTAAQSEQTLRGLLDVDPAKRIATLRGGLVFLQDGHARVRTEELRDPVGIMQPPVRLRMVDSEPIVSALLHPIAGELGVKPGDRVVAVDGEPAGRRRARLAGWLAAGTDHARGLYVANRLLAGPPEVDVTVVLEGLDRR
ncbi:MAG: hypothetical protein ACOVT5_05550, partial [Armatimonadaceae bacterium]